LTDEEKMRNLSQEIMPLCWQHVPALLRRLMLGTLMAIFFSITVPDAARGQTCTGGIPVNLADSSALVALHEATGGSSWSYPPNATKWREPGIPVTFWFGVTLQQCRVSFLSLSNRNLTRTLPDELGSLPEATFISITNNASLTGSIPATLGNLKKLESLGLHTNNLDGEIPATLGDLPNLTSLNLSRNQLTGSIPKEFDKLGSLEFLLLHTNKLSESIPAELGKLSKLRELDLTLNQLSGAIPAELGNLTNLGGLQLSFNQLSGAIPAALSKLSNLAILRLNSNQLSGEIPAALGNLTQLQLLWLNGNQLSGEIPTALGNLTNLQFDLNLANNRLTGAIPTDLGKLANLQTLNLSSNQLTGSIPKELGDLANAISISLSNNKLTGAVPPEFAKLSKLSSLLLQGNQLEDLPDLTGLSALRTVFLLGNRFTFEDLEPNAPLFSRATVTYSPQAEVETDVRAMGKDVVLAVNVGGQNNLYQWFKDGQAITGATENTFTLFSVDLNDRSQYHCQVTNTVVTGLTISSRKVSLQQAAFVVNSTGDLPDANPSDGVCDVDPNMPGDQCTLRAAIQTVNALGENAANPVARPVAFKISPEDAVPVITPPDDLPDIDFPIVIDGTTQAAGRVRLAGKGSAYGLNIEADGSTIKGLLIDHFSIGLSVLASGNTVEENFLVENKLGISINGNNNAIRKNIVAQNDIAGISISGLSTRGTGNIIEDNLIGTEENGFTPRPNGIGVNIAEKARLNTVKNNLISANNIGIQLKETSENIVEGNRIGTTADGQSALGNDIGVLLEKSEKNLIKNNVIADSRHNGIFLSAESDYNVIESNKIGTNAGGATALGNGEHGVEIENALDILVKDNVISGNKGAGVFISGLQAIENTLENNKIGTNAAGTEPLGNGMEGVLLLDVPATNVLANLISANGKSGVVIEGSEASKTLVSNNSIGTDIFGNDVLGVMGNREHGVVIVGVPSSTLSENLIAFNHNAGILLQAPSGAIERNNIHHNLIVGIDVAGGSDELNIVGNRIHLNGTNINADNAEFIAQNNNVFNGTSSGTGIHLTRSHAVIQGNNLTGDAGDALTLEQGSTALITQNNILGNQGFGLNNRDLSMSIAAPRNWWGDASGPGGAGPGSGDEVSAGVNFANWLAQPVAVVAAAAGDTLTLVAGRIDTVSVFLQNWQKPDDVLNVSLSDNQGWLQQPTAFAIALADSLGAEARIAIAVPANISDGSADNVRVIATSQANPSAADTTTFTVVSQMAVLVNIRVAPDSVTLAPGDSAQFTAAGLDQFGNDFSFTPAWSATGGVIDASGLYIAGNSAGNFLVTAAGPNAQIQGQAVVRIEGTVGVEGDAPAIPTAFHLYQNYPNPFWSAATSPARSGGNPETQIRYDLPKAAYVRVEIFNILGEKVKTLVDEKKPAGAHKIIWNGRTSTGGSAVSGVYIYRLQADDSSSRSGGPSTRPRLAQSSRSGQGFVQTRKLILLR
jgi:CSLREA domain-containing protein